MSSVIKYPHRFSALSIGGRKEEKIFKFFVMTFQKCSPVDDDLKINLNGNQL